MSRQHLSSPSLESPAQLLRQLIRFDTTNPPGNEAACIAWARERLEAAGLTTEILARDAARPNLIARLAGAGQAPPLLLYGHVDVVTTADQRWRHPPFEGVLEDGWIWGRGAVDMKGGVAMMMAAVLRARAEGMVPKGDILLVLVSDEEAGGDYGASFLVDRHPDRFEGVRYAIGEFGGFTLPVAGVKFYPIQVAEKRMCWMKATVRGAGGHGSLPHCGGAMARLGRLLTALDRRLPVHITPAARLMIEAMAGALPEPLASRLPELLDPDRTDAVLDSLGPLGTFLDPLLHDIVNATVVRGGSKINVVPPEVTVEMDGRLLPGREPADALAELRERLDPDVELEVLRADEGPARPDMGWFETLDGVLREMDPDAVPLPLLLLAVTDGRHFSRLGIQTYGFLPMNLPPDFDFMRTVHAADERIPASAVEFGAEAVYRAIARWNG